MTDENPADQERPTEQELRALPTEQEMRAVRRAKDAVWLSPADALAIGGTRPDLETVLRNGKVACRFYHSSRWWQWREAAPREAIRIGTDGASLVDTELWVLRVNEQEWRVKLGLARSDTAALAPDPTPAPPAEAAAPSPVAVKKKSNAGAPSRYDWEEASLYAEQLWNDRGDPREPSNATDDWRSDFDIARLVVEHLQKVDPDREPPDPKYVADKIRPAIKRLRGG